MKMSSLAPWNWMEDREEFDSAANSIMYPFSRMQREMERMMDMGPGGGSERNRQGRGEVNGGQMSKPALNVSECDEAYHLEFDVPGVKRDDLDVTFENGKLVLRGERHSDKEDSGHRYRKIEKRYGSFERTVALPDNVDPDRIEARFENGVLNLRVAKNLAVPEHRKRIEIG